jgi:hypothetical protein
MLVVLHSRELFSEIRRGAAGCCLWLGYGNSCMQVLLSLYLKNDQN